MNIYKDTQWPINTSLDGEVQWQITATHVEASVYPFPRVAYVISQKAVTSVEGEDPLWAWQARSESPSKRGSTRRSLLIGEGEAIDPEAALASAREATREFSKRIHKVA